MREGSERKGIIIVEYDDFLREILGNLLHKMGYYIVSGESIAKVRKQLKQHPYHLAILGESVKDFYGKKTMREITHDTGNIRLDFFLITESGRNPLAAEEKQIPTEKLSLRKILHYVQSTLH